MATAMADNDGDGNGRRQGQWQQQWLTATRQRWQQRWFTATAAMAHGSGNGDGWLQQQRQRQRQRSRSRRWWWRWQRRRPWWGQPWRKGCLFMWRQCVAPLVGRHLASTPMDIRKVHSPALHHGGDTAKVFAPLQGGGFLTAHHGLFFQFTEQPSVCPPALFRRSRTLLSADWCSTSSTPPRTPSAYWQSTPAPIALFVKVSPGRACNDYNLNVLCWCEMTNLSATFFISQSFAQTQTDNTFEILKTPCCDSWDIQGQSLSRVFKAFFCTTLSPSLGACICLTTF